MDQALVLNADFTPHDVVTWQQAWSMVHRGVAYLLRAYDGKVIRSVRASFAWPAVIVLKKLSSRRSLRCTRENLFARDHYMCGYCGMQPKTLGGNPDLSALTFDHVVPRAQCKDGKTVVLPDGRRVGLTSWSNLLTSCGRCNLNKRDRTPAQAGMTPRFWPFKPNPVESVMIQLRRMKIPDEWKESLPLNSPWRDYWNSELTD